MLALLASLASTAWAESPYADLQVSVHAGLIQPVLLRGFNAAADVRYKRLVLTYSHGEGLDLTRTPGVLPEAQRDAGVRVRMPWTTGFGVGAQVVDELQVLVDFKAHRFEVDTGLDPASYTTLTVGAEVGYRLFVWEGLFVHPVVRFWPNVWTSQPAGFALETEAGAFRHDPLSQGVGGLFGNVLLGWAFDVEGKRDTFTLIQGRR
ncbi:MAG: hypothetical protein KTR31_26580 [Myxococcales bacterium]|nr:hypothetical protein [Myxococcales bacterium]